jgi:cytochrome c oxidase assembly factor CtaG
MEAPLEVTALVPALAIGYAAAIRRQRPSHGRLAAFAGGITLIVAAFATRLEPLALHTFLWAHLLQNVVLAEWAPALLVLAVPAALATRIRVPAVPALVAWLATYFLWHLPWFYDAALRRPHWLLHVEHLSYLVAGCLFWWPVIHGRIGAGAKAAYLFAAFVLASPLGLMLALLPKPVYGIYKAAAPTWGIGALTDQEIAGATMAAEQAAVLFAAFGAFFLRFLAEEQSAGVLDELRPRPTR